MCTRPNVSFNFSVQPQFLQLTVYQLFSLLRACGHGETFIEQEWNDTGMLALQPTIGPLYQQTLVSKKEYRCAHT